MKSRSIYCVSLIFMAGCVQLKLQDPPEGFTIKLEATKSEVRDKVSLQSSGYFNNLSAKQQAMANGFDVSYAYSPMFLFDNGILLHRLNQFRDSVSFERRFFTNPDFHEFTSLNSWGVYKIHGDTIYAEMFYPFRRSRVQLKEMVLTHFQGLIKDSTTIVDWRMVPPYPKPSSMKWNDGRMSSLKKPAVFKFQQSAAKSQIDSSQAWIYELLDDQ